VEAKGAAFVPIALLATAGDQLLKLHATSTVSVGAREPLIGNVLSVTHVPSMGGAFGFFGGWLPDAQLVGFATLALCAATVILLMYRGLAPGERGTAAGLGAMLGGIAGHAIDRLRYGSGLDIIHLGPVESNAVPDFSLADVAIVLGLVTLIVELLATELATRAAERPRR
jgi:lipoprotein signal peptidase